MFKALGKNLHFRKTLCCSFQIATAPSGAAAFDNFCFFDKVYTVIAYAARHAVNAISYPLTVQMILFTYPVSIFGKYNINYFIGSILIIKRKCKARLHPFLYFVRFIYRYFVCFNEFTRIIFQCFQIKPL